MKKLLIALILIISSNVYADTIQIPFECNPKQIQKDFKKIGYKLDLDGTNRSKDSFGFIVNKGTSYDIVTYKAVSMKDLKKMQEFLITKDK